MDISFDHWISDSHERPLPKLTPRQVAVPYAPDNALAILGMRRTGKTWFCFQRMQELLGKGVPRMQMLYINFEDERLLGFTVKDFQLLLDAFYRCDPSIMNKECYFFFDEVQNVDGWPQFIRRLLDQSQAKITITGSSAKLLGSEIHTSLRGRALPCEMFPFSFTEYLGANNIACPQRIPSSKTRLELERACEAYLLNGGFPGTLSMDATTRRQMLQQYLDVVILRDVIERHQVSSVQALRAFVRHVLHSPATRLSVNKIYNDFRSRGLSCSKNSLHAFVDYLQDAYLIYTVPIHTRNERVRRANPKKVYLVDTGLLSAASANITQDRGALLENLVFLHLRRSGNIIEYFHAEQGFEIDFVVRDPLSGAILELIQVCWSIESPSTRQRELRSLCAAMDALECKHATIVTWRENSQNEIPPDIRVIPAWHYLLPIY